MSEKDFFWNLFLQTGSIDAYLLLKKEAPSEETSRNTADAALK